ncbi:hypothetical protein AB0M50_53705, partial [Nonomuraea fuscirosea]
MSLTVMAVGDLVVDEPDPASFFDPTRETLGRGGVVIGHVEVPHSTSTAQVSTDVSNAVMRRAYTPSIART